MQGNKPQLAWVLEEQSGRLRLFTSTKRESKLPAARVLPWIGPQGPSDASRQTISETLDACHARREELEARVDAMEIWELAQGEVEHATIEWFAELIWEHPDADMLAAMGRALLACKTHFKFAPPHFEIHPRDKVEARLVELALAQERERVSSAGGVFFRELWEAWKRGKSAPKATLEPKLEPDVAERLQGLLFARMADDQDADPLWKQVTAGLPDDPHLPLHLARAWGLVPEHHNVLLDQAGLALGDGWAEAHAVAIDAVAAAVAASDDAVDPHSFVSIDAATTRDVDDAFHVEPLGEGWRLRLTLACPVVGWEWGDPLDRAVAARATSVYLPEGTIHMLPERLGTGCFSLKADGPRPALVVAMDLDARGELVACALTRTRAVIAANLTYDHVEACLARGEDAHAACGATALASAHALAEALRARRIERGAVIIDREDPDITLIPAEGGGVLDAGVRVALGLKPDCPRAQLMVSEMMILANAAVAAWAAERGVPLLHRTQDIALPKEHAGVWREPQETFQVVKSLGSSILEVRPRPHASLGVRAYSPVSSPIRRYADLINMRQLVHYLAHGEPQWGEEALRDMLPALLARLDAAGRVQRFRPRYWKLLYFKQQGTEKAWPAVVVDENQTLVSVSLPDEQIFVRGPRRLFGDKVFPGQRFLVRLGKIDPLNNDIFILEAWEDEGA
ncbi:MAG: ribonuclease catalytic domain-containing protein [Desulfovibrionaceae bacterium]